MTQLQFGMNAYERTYAGAPEIQLLNRFVEKLPTNTVEQVGLLARPGTTLLGTFTPNAYPGSITNCYSKPGLFNGDLFVVSGSNLYRYRSGFGSILISGAVAPSNTKFAWDSGIGYQHLFVADGLLLQYYDGGTLASGALTGTASNQVVGVGGIYYQWGTNMLAAADGTFANPYQVNPYSDYLGSMANAINFVGTPGVDFSASMIENNPYATAVATGGPPSTTLTATATDPLTGNTVTTTVTGTGLAWSGPTLAGGGAHTLKGINTPTGEPVKCVCTLDHYVMASIGDTNKMFYILPGETTIQPLNFFSKESNPDPITGLLTWGDNFLALGSGSIETWYATGVGDAPFSPIEGRTTARGALGASVVLVQDTPMFVGSDGIVYAMGQGLTRVSTNGIEERIYEGIAPI